MRVLLQLLKAEDGFNPLNTIADTAEANTTGVLVTTFQSEHPDFTGVIAYFCHRMLSITSSPWLLCLFLCWHRLAKQNFNASRESNRHVYRGPCDQGILRFDPATIAIALAGCWRRCRSRRTIRQSTWLARNRGRSSTRPYQTGSVSAERIACFTLFLRS